MNFKIDVITLTFWVLEFGISAPNYLTLESDNIFSMQLASIVSEGSEDHGSSPVVYVSGEEVGYSLVQSPSSAPSNCFVLLLTKTPWIDPYDTLMISYYPEHSLIKKIVTLSTEH